MGARSVARSVYLFLLAVLLVVGGAVVQSTLAGLTPSLRDACGASVLTASQGGGRLAGYATSVPACAASRSYAADFYAGCYSCSGQTTT